MTTMYRRRRVFIDSFSGPAADLKFGKRNSTNVLHALAADPKVSCFDMSELDWLRRGVETLKSQGLVKNMPAAYPWCRYEVTPEGRAVIESTK